MKYENETVWQKHFTKTAVLATGLVALATGCQDMANLMDSATHPEGWQLPAVPVRVINQNQGSKNDSPIAGTNALCVIPYLAEVQAEPFETATKSLRATITASESRFGNEIFNT